MHCSRVCLLVHLPHLNLFFRITITDFSTMLGLIMARPSSKNGPNAGCQIHIFGVLFRTTHSQSLIIFYCGCKDAIYDTKPFLKGKEAKE